MGKSTETFNKKEREKKKLRKQQDKREKAEDRKANAAKGKGLEDMMAYVDENGNITSVPTDPAKRSKVQAENIQIGVPKREDVELDTLRTGIVAFFNEEKGYGFIRDLQTQESIFVHINSLAAPIKEGNKVTFETEPGQKGPVAIKVNLG